jgi:LacI family transcriptional regulator
MAGARIQDVAALAGVSQATVSNALNFPERVNSATLSRIHQAVAQLGYVRNEAARQLRAGTNRAVGMVVLDVANPFFTDVMHGAEEVLTADGRPLIMGNSNQDASRESTYLDLFEQQRMSGLLIVPVTSAMERLQRLHARGIEVVLVDRAPSEHTFGSVSVDDHMGGTLATQHLLEIGRRRIAFIGGPATLSQVKLRLAAAREAVARHGDAQLIVTETDTMNAEAGRIAAEQLVDQPRQDWPDAIFAANDLIALGALQALTLAGISVPEEIALLGYDDIEFAGAAAIPLTSVRQPAAEMGRLAASMLLERIENPDRPSRRTMLSPELIVRQSTIGHSRTSKRRP